jgi:hypothetical protein
MDLIISTQIVFSKKKMNKAREVEVWLNQLEMQQNKELREFTV